MFNHDEYLNRLEKLILEQWEAATQSWSNMENVTDLYELGKTYLQGGKRTRARLSNLGYRLGISTQSDQSVSSEASLLLGAALEFYQASALVHDDIIDRAQSRRGQPCLQHQFSQLHQKRNLTNDRQHFGSSAALLAGDLLLSTAEETAVQAFTIPTWLSPVQQQNGISEFFQMTKEVAIGQYLDLYLEHNPQTTRRQIAETICLKSARYSVARPLMLGAQLAGTEQSLCKKLFKLGEQWGMAFQLRDDHLGIFGDPATTGKQSGEDIREGKRTHLWALIMEQAPTDLRDQLAKVFGNQHASSAEINQLQTVLGSSPIIKEHEGLIDSYYQNGRADLYRLDLPDHLREELETLGSELVYRQA